MIDETTAAQDWRHYPGGDNGLEEIEPGKWVPVTNETECAICGTRLDDGGNNPQPLPLPVQARVCDDCDAWRVAPARVVLERLASPMVDTDPHGDGADIIMAAWLAALREVL